MPRQTVIGREPNKRGSPTIREIAEAAGVDKSTVSCVLNGKARQARISPAREQQVLEVARRLKFRPNAAARATRSGRFGSIALLMSTTGAYSTLPARTQAAITDALALRDIHLLFTRLPDEKLIAEGAIPKILSQAFADGLLINYTDHFPAKMNDVLRSGLVPSIWINSKQEWDCIHPDDERAGYDATNRLIKAGHKKIAYVDYCHAADELHLAHYSAIDRHVGYERAMKQARLKSCTVRGAKSYGPQDLRPAIASLLSASTRPTAVLTYGDFEAVPLFVVSREMGLRIPADIEIATFSNNLISVIDVFIPTHVVPQISLGIRAAELILQKVESPAELIKPQAVAFKYVETNEQFILAEGDQSAEFLSLMEPLSTAPNDTTIDTRRP